MFIELIDNDGDKTYFSVSSITKKADGTYVTVDCDGKTNTLDLENGTVVNIREGVCISGIVEKENEPIDILDVLRNSFEQPSSDTVGWPPEDIPIPGWHGDKPYIDLPISLLWRYCKKTCRLKSCE